MTDDVSVHSSSTSLAYLYAVTSYVCVGVEGPPLRRHQSQLVQLALCGCPPLKAFIQKAQRCSHHAVDGATVRLILCVQPCSPFTCA